MIFKKLLVIGSLCLVGAQAMASKRAGEDPQHSPGKKRRIYDSSEQVSHADVSLNKLVSKGCFEEALSLIQSGKANVNEKNKMGQPVLLNVGEKINIVKLYPGREDYTTKLNELQKLRAGIVSDKNFDGNFIDSEDGTTYLHQWALGLNTVNLLSVDEQSSIDDRDFFENYLLPRCKGVINNGNPKDGRTALHYLSNFGGIFLHNEGPFPANVDTLYCSDALLKNGANPNARDKLGRTPLHNCNVIENALLLSHYGASPYVSDIDGKKPADLVENEVMYEVLSPEKYNEFGSLVGRQILLDAVEQEQEKAKRIQELREKEARRLQELRMEVEGGMDFKLMQQKNPSAFTLVQERQYFGSSNLHGLDVPKAILRNYKEIDLV